MRIRNAVVQTIAETIVLVFSCGVAPAWIGQRIFALVTGGPVA